MVAPAFNLTVCVPWVASIIENSAGWTSIANLLTPQPGEKAAATAGARYVTFHVNNVVREMAAQEWRQLALLYTNLTASDTVRVRVSPDYTFATGVLYDTGALAPWALAEQADDKLRPGGYRHFFHQLPDASYPQNLNHYVRVDLSLAGDRTFGRLVCGPRIQPEYNADYGDTSWGYEEPDPPELLDSGVEVLYETTPAPYFKFKLGWLTEAEMNADWEPLSRLAHLGEPVLVARRPDPHSHRHNGLFYGRLRLTPIVAQDFDMYEVQGQVRSMV